MKALLSGQGRALFVLGLGSVLFMALYGILNRNFGGIHHDSLVESY